MNLLPNKHYIYISYSEPYHVNILKQERICWVIIDIYVFYTYISFWQLYRTRFCPSLNIPCVQHTFIHPWASYTIGWEVFLSFRTGVLMLYVTVKFGCQPCTNNLKCHPVCNIVYNAQWPQSLLEADHIKVVSERIIFHIYLFCVPFSFSCQ